MRWKPNPTTDLYFLNSCGDLVASFLSRSKPVKRIGANSFQCGNRFLVIRKETAKVLEYILSHSNRELTYVMDDNIWGVHKDASLTANYRNRMVHFRDNVALPLMEWADHIVVSSTYLMQFVNHMNKPVSLLRPAWNDKVPKADHYQYSDQIFNLVHMGTNSHKAGFDVIVPIVERLLNTFSHVTFTYHSNVGVMGALDNHPRVMRKSLLRWSLYRHQLGRFPYHLALYPIVDTPINRGRSINKLLEHPLSGCGAVYNNDWIHAHHINEQGGGICLPHDVDRWVEEISNLIETPDAARALYSSAVQAFSKLNQLQEQRDFWQKYFIKF